jgi:DNA-binding SARP family transcriptional activator
VVSAEGDFYFLDPDLSQWCDTREFEILAGQVSAEGGGVLSDAKERAALACLALYHGDFLEGIWEDWTFQPRTSLLEMWFAVQYRLAEHYLLKENGKAAEHACREMLSRDACREEAHLGLMRAALGMGRRDQAVARYHAYCETLKKEMKMEPSAAAKRLYQEIVDRS